MPSLFVQMDYIAGSFYDGFVLYAKALQETLADGGAQNDGINITMRTQNRRFWGEPRPGMCPFSFFLFYIGSVITNSQLRVKIHVCVNQARNNARQ